MARYLVDFDTSSDARERFDAVIVGGGLAGLYCALRLPRGMKIAVLCKKGLKDSDSYLAQGGIAASIGGDDRGLHIRDTLSAGCGINDRKAVEILVNESENAVRSLTELGVKFDRDAQGRLRRSLEGNHSVKRILHVDGDATGRGIMTALMADCAGRDNIRLFEDTFAVDLLTRDGRCVGVLAERGGRRLFFSAPRCVLATGGIGQLYPTTTNSVVLTGDGVAMAHRAGAQLAALEFIQFHPTSLYAPGRPGGRAFLISEAVRGEGALLRNKNGERFMPQYDERLELAPRDVVARAIFDQMKKTSSPCVYLDITTKSREFLERRFPTIVRTCDGEHIDISKDWIPVAPCEHYFMGGVRTDYNGRTGIGGLYAVGECASTGVHGANRLASNSLLENVVFGGRAAADIAGSAPGAAAEPDIRFSAPRKSPPAQVEALRQALRALMRRDVGIIRSRRALTEALEKIDETRRVFLGARLSTLPEIETADMYETARLIVASAAADRRSIGSHFLID